MVSDDLYALADKLSTYANNGTFVPPMVAACMAHALMDHANTAAVLETLPFDVGADFLDVLPELVFVRAVEASATRPWPKDLGDSMKAAVP